MFFTIEKGPNKTNQINPHSLKSAYPDMSDSDDETERKAASTEKVFIFLDPFWWNNFWKKKISLHLNYYHLNVLFKL